MGANLDLGQSENRLIFLFTKPEGFAFVFYLFLRQEILEILAPPWHSLRVFSNLEQKKIKPDFFLIDFLLDFLFTSHSFTGSLNSSILAGLGNLKFE